MRIHFLPNKLALRIHPKAAPFLKAYSTNTLDKPRNAFVDLKGRIVCVFDQMFISPEKVIIVIERQFLNRLREHLKKYLFLEGVSLDEAPEFKIYYDLDSSREPERGEIYIVQKCGSLIGTSQPIESNVTDEQFTRFRLENDLPLQGVDYDEELLLSVGDEDLVSYTKGCYLGQEIIARVHYKGKPPKKLIVEKDPVTGEPARFAWAECL